MLFIACETANHDSKSLLHAATLAGAECAVGFTQSIYTVEASEWTVKFISLMAEGNTVNEAVTAINKEIEDMSYEEKKYWNVLTSVTIVGNRDYRLAD